MLWVWCNRLRSKASFVPKVYRALPYVILDVRICGIYTILTTINLGSAEDVPRALFKIAGIADLIAAPEEVQSGDEEIQEVARGIAHAAEQHRAGASTHRLGKPKVATQGISAGLKQLQKKKTSIVAERKVKKTENEIAKTGVRISGQVWLKVESGKMNAVSTLPNSDFDH